MFKTLRFLFVELKGKEPAYQKRDDFSYPVLNSLIIHTEITNNLMG